MEGHEAILRRLLGAHRSGRLGHTLLLAGGGGRGAYDIALRLAQALLCEANRVQPAHAREACAVCRNVAHFNHPDFLCVSPLSPEYKRQQGNDRQPEPEPVVRALMEDCYAALEVGANWGITADQARQLIQWASMTPWEARGKVVLIAEADKVNEASADILLKTLEEPPPDVTLILVSARPQDLLPTVRSRCHQVRVPPLSEGRMLALLAERGFPEDQARAVLPLAGGDLWQARALLGGQANRLRSEAGRLIGVALDPTRGTAEVMVEARRVLEGASTSEVSELVRWVVWWLRDLLLALAEARPAGDEALRDILPGAAKLGQVRLMAWLREADRAYEMLGRNVTPPAVVTALMVFPRDERRIGAAATFPPLQHVR